MGAVLPCEGGPKPMRILITAGPTREPIDQVRFIGNRSSGRMGAALSRAAVQAGHKVTLLLGTVDQGQADAAKQSEASVLRFETTADLQKLLHENFPACDLLIMAAAVADYRPAMPQEGKLPRQADGAKMLKLELEPTPDLVAELAGQRRDDQRIVAFALEMPDNLLERAAAKARRKGVDAIVANPLQTMNADQICAVWIPVQGQVQEPGAMSKGDFARWLINKAQEL